MSNHHLKHTELKREDRYIVIKRSDLEKVPFTYRRPLVEPLKWLHTQLPDRKYLVIESDWPEYEKAWAMIEARMTGKGEPESVKTQGESPEQRFEHFIQNAIDNAPEPLRRLGEHLTHVLDEDEWATAERLLNGAIVAAVTPPRNGDEGLPTDMLQRINEHMNGGQCPTEHSLGECAAIWSTKPNRFQAALYLWDDHFNDSAAVAEWFRAQGAQDISVCLTHFSDANDDRNGKTIDGIREWIVDFHMPTNTGSPEGLNQPAGSAQE